MLKFGDYSISRKLTRMNMFVSGAALLLACAAFVAYDVVAFRQDIARNLSIEAQIAGSNSVSALLFNDPREAEKTLSALRAAPNIVSAHIYTLEGQPFAAYWRDRGGQAPALPAIPAGQTEAHWLKDGQVMLVRSIVFQGKPTGIVYLQRDLQDINGRLARYAGIAATVLLMCLFAALQVSSIFRKSVADSIVHLADLARTVSRDKDYSVRAAPTGGRDELATLIETFNEMLAQIQERDGALQEAHDELEQRVQARTGELAEANEQLRSEIGERKNITEALIEANKELEAFSYSVSHDLRAPLRTIDGFSHALLEDCADKLDDEGKAHLNRIRAATQRMGMLIDDLLNLSRLSRTEMRRQSLDISALAGSIASELQKAQPERQIELRIEDGLKTTADPGLLRVVLENLLNNAWKFTSKRDSAHIEFGMARGNGNGAAAYFVRDDGAGFDPAYADRLFGVFQRLHAMTEFAGTGVGLATVQRIVHRHGGRIWAESAVGQGATFYFTLGETVS
jgi:signal transduction histidine kinase